MIVNCSGLPQTSLFAFDAGAGIDIIRISAFLKGFKDGIFGNAKLVKSRDANGRP